MGYLGRWQIVTYFYVEGFTPDGRGRWAIVGTFADAVAVAFVWLSTAEAVRATITNAQGSISVAA